MEVEKYYEGGPILIKPKIFEDDRGYFFESFNEKEFKEKVANVDFVQDNQSCSAYGTIRGLHFQKGEHAQAKLVRVVRGSVIDIAVDIRPESEYFGKFFAAFLSGLNNYQFFIPRGFAHGFIALEDNTVFQYKCDNYYCKESEGSIFYADSEINIPWFNWVSLRLTKLSEKDENAPCFYEYKKEIGYNIDEQNVR